VLYGAPPVLGGRGNSGAQAVLSAPALITLDSLGTRLIMDIPRLEVKGVAVEL